jgi:class 3 adenylate cyclase
MRPELPTGTVTFLFTDIEGSTRLLHALGPDGYAEALAEHRRLLREAFAKHDGVEIDTQGDAFFVAFPTAHGAAGAARTGHAALAGGPVRVRVGLHTGVPTLADGGYVGADVHRGARIAALAHGGQTIVSPTTAALLDGADLLDLGARSHRRRRPRSRVRLFRPASVRLFRPASLPRDARRPGHGGGRADRNRGRHEQPAADLIGQRLFAAVEVAVETAPAGSLELKGFARPVTAYEVVASSRAPPGR